MQAILAGLLSLAFGWQADARVEVNVTHIGYPVIGKNDVMRPGAWTPVIVDLALSNEATFDGTVRVAQLDNDGDACFDAVDVHLRSETGGTQRVVLYVMPNLSLSDKIAVEVRSAEGEPVQVICQGELTYHSHSPQPLEIIAQDDVLLLVLSTGTAGRIAELNDTNLVPPFFRPVHVGHLAPADLPPLWIGLESVDYVLWEDAQPEELTAQQLEALLQWVRHGGTLLVASGPSAASLVQSKLLQPVLPADIGEVTPVTQLRHVREKVLGQPLQQSEPDARQRDWLDQPFPSPIAAVRCQRREGSAVIAREEALDSDLITRRREGRGHVILVGATLRDLFSAPSSIANFFRTVLHFLPDAKEKATPNSLFPRVATAIGFLTSGGGYLFFAAMFSILYVLAATLGTWKFLSQRGWKHHSWTAFAATGAVASVVSVSAVGAMRGFGDRLHQISVVDAEAGASFGYATALFGLKTSVDKEVDLWLPGNWLSADEPIPSDGFLRPLPPAQEFADPSASQFADPEEYRVAPATAVVDDVRIRATLKRFEGRWQGPLKGRLTANVTIRGHKITEDSYLVNDLGVELKESVLIYTTSEPDFAVPRDLATYVFGLGDMPSDGRKVSIADLCYPNMAKLTQKEETEVFERARLSRAQATWGSSFRQLLTRFSTGPEHLTYSSGQEKNALLLLSTIGDYDPVSHQGAGGGQFMGMGIETWSRDRFRQLDLRDQLDAGRYSGRGSMILIGFAEDAGPLRLFSRSGDRPFRPLEPDKTNTWTMYRIRIPTTALPGEKPKPADPYDMSSQENEPG